ncbi:Gfo/Idh/MocA family oxidoreductase [Chloroflexi bacterium TSY]|nr:Gfo/Idh/MocA family oxidoreductase [Chloroflexi bacterium TSY]
MTNTEHPFRILQVGLGNRGTMWSEIIHRRDDVVHSGVVDISADRLAAYHEQHPTTPTFTALEQALIQTQSDAVLLVTPPDGHLAQARVVFDAGLPLLSEKPLTLDLAEAVEIVQLAQAHALPLMVGLNFRYLPVSQKIRELVTTNVLGSPGFGQFTYQRNRDGRVPRLNKYPLTMEHPMMLEQSIHHLDLIRHCYGREVVRVMCRTWNPPWSMYAHDSNVHCLLTLQDGMEVNYLGTWTGGWDELQFEWRTDCTEGMIVQRQLFEDLAMARMQDKSLTSIDLPPCQAFFDDTDALLSVFIAHLWNDGPLECSGQDHLYTLALCFAAIESSQTGVAIQMNDFYVRHNISQPTDSPTDLAR